MTGSIFRLGDPSYLPFTFICHRHWKHPIFSCHQRKAFRAYSDAWMWEGMILFDLEKFLTAAPREQSTNTIHGTIVYLPLYIWLIFIYSFHVGKYTVRPIDSDGNMRCPFVTPFSPGRIWEIDWGIKTSWKRAFLEPMYLDVLLEARING